MTEGDLPARAHIDPGEVSVSHIAGLVIEIGGRLAQRCSWCGADLLGPLPGAPNVPKTAGWPAGAVVRIATDGTTHARGAIGRYDHAQPPLDLCAYQAPDDATEAGPPGQWGPTADYGDG